MMLHRSQHWCRIVMRRHAKSFFFSTRFLPAPKRTALEALYGFFRYVDDVVDEGDAPLAERQAALANARYHLDRLDDDGYTGNLPWLLALRAAVRRYPIARSELYRLVAGCELDLGDVRIGSMAELERYAGAVAGSVGRTIIPVLGALDADSNERAERLGIAMQLTNVLRDVAEDERRGRAYLPLDGSDGMSISETMRAVATQARILYREAPVLAARLPNDGSRIAVLTAAALYEQILGLLEQRHFDPNGGRVYVGIAAKVQVAARCAVAAHTGFATIR